MDLWLAIFIEVVNPIRNFIYACRATPVCKVLYSYILADATLKVTIFIFVDDNTTYFVGSVLIERNTIQGVFNLCSNANQRGDCGGITESVFKRPQTTNNFRSARAALKTLDLYVGRSGIRQSVCQLA